MAMRIEDKLDEALQVTTNEIVDDPRPEDSDVAEVAELVETAELMQRFASRPVPSSGRKDQAFATLQAALSDARTQQTQGGSMRGRWARIFGALGTNWLRPSLLQAAGAIGVIMLFGGALFGASAAGADITQPIRILFNSESQVKESGVITGLAADSIVVQTDDDSVLVAISDITQITDDEENVIEFESLAIGETVEIKGALQSDDTIRAFRIRVER